MDLGFGDFRPVRVRKRGGSNGIRGGAQRVRAHMADGDGLTGGSRSSLRGRSLHITRTDATGKPTADLLGRAQLTPGERAGPGDERARAIIIWSLSFKEPEDALCAICSPSRDKASVGLAQRLW